MNFKVDTVNILLSKLGLSRASYGTDLNFLTLILLSRLGIRRQNVSRARAASASFETKGADDLHSSSAFRFP